MNKAPNLKEIMKKNPSISQKEIKKAIALSEELRRLGLQPRGYRLPMPHERHQAKSGCADIPDPRTVQLSKIL